MADKFEDNDFDYSLTNINPDIVEHKVRTTGIVTGKEYIEDFVELRNTFSEKQLFKLALNLTNAKHSKKQSFESFWDK